MGIGFPSTPPFVPSQPPLPFDPAGLAQGRPGSPAPQSVTPNPATKPATKPPTLPSTKPAPDVPGSVSVDPKNPNQLQPQDGKVVVQVFPNLNQGTRSATHGIVLHQTGGSAASVLNGYKNTSIGAHFLIAKDGTVYQTAGLDQKANHVGKVRPKGYEPTAGGGNKRVAAELDAYSTDILDKMDKKKISFKDGVKLLSDHELTKPYGNDPTDPSTRMPSNSDSIGIEFEGLVGKDGKYEPLSDAQKKAGAALVQFLETKYNLGPADVYRHPDLSYKDYTEALGAKEGIEDAMP
jgi:N-acetylmuramoyl-L-alanine amidase